MRNRKEQKQVKSDEYRGMADKAPDKKAFAVFKRKPYCGMPVLCAGK